MPSFTNALRRLSLLIAVALVGVGVRAAEVIPPAPANHFNDYAGIVPAATAARLNQELAQFERDSSNQIVVAIYPKMQSDSSVEDYAVRVAQKWGVGQKDKKNGAVLFVFQQSHDVWITTGYGLEGALPDALCKRIIENEIVPRFRAGDFGGGLAAGVHAMMAATRGEYRGTGRTQRESRSPIVPQQGLGGFIAFLFFIAMVVLSAIISRRRNTVYGSRGRRTVWTGTPWDGGWGGGGGGSFGGGSFGGGGGGSFSGGGGSFGGGGAGGKW